MTVFFVDGVQAAHAGSCSNMLDSRNPVLKCGQRRLDTVPVRIDFKKIGVTSRLHELRNFRRYKKNLTTASFNPVTPIGTSVESDG